MAADMFGYNSGVSVETPPGEGDAAEVKTDINSGQEVKVDENGNPIDDINAGDTKKTEVKPEEKDNPDNVEIPHDYAVGTSFEVDGATYTVNDKGDVVDKDGNVFKPAAEVKEWIKAFEVTEEESEKELSVPNIAKALDIEIVDEQGKPVEYENTPEGVKAFVKDAIETGREEVAEATINTLYANYPFVKPMIDYYIANGNSLEGFNQVPDRSNIQIDDANEAQQEAIIRTAWAEEKRRGNVDSYIAYLKSQGTLAATAKDELAALVEKDKAYAKELEDNAKAEQKRQIEEATAYWNNVKNIVNSKKIAGYQIPDTIIVERDGKKVSVTSDDFFNYLYRTDKDGFTGYTRDLRATKPEDALQDEILRAYLKFTGGTYADLVQMAITEETIKKLKLNSKRRTSAGTIRINPPKPAEDPNAKENFGY